MTDRKRRRLVQAGAAIPLLGWGCTRAQSSNRNLLANERKAVSAVASGASLLIAPRRALVIGNSAYGFGPLKNPANDAKAIGEELKRAGFDAVVRLDLPRKEMLEAIRAHGEWLATARAIGLFYYAGHGLQLAWRNYLVPVDAQLSRVEDIQTKCVDVNAVIEGIVKAANPMNVIILDACRENPFGDIKLDQKGLSQLDAPPDTLLAYATAPGNLASDGEGANGLYTEQLLREMKVPEAKIEDVFKRVRLAVRRRSNGQQIPWESTSLEEDFWFIPPREMQKLADDERERIRKAQEAERLRQERIAKAQADEAERVRREAEAERLRQERIAKAQADEAQRLRREAEAERARQEQIAKTQAAEVERQRREAEAERQRQESAEKKRREQIERAYKEDQERRRKQEESDRAYEEELSFWERVSKTRDAGPLEEYLRRYPSGRFTEIAQAQLDYILRREGEKRVETVSSPQNPYSQGSARLNTEYKVGDGYTYNVFDIISKALQATITQTITRVTESEVIYNDGSFVTDLLGNPLRHRDGRTWTANQSNPSEFFVGKHWKTRFVADSPSKGTTRRVFEFRITAKERVKVPAGTFETFRIEGRSGGFSVRGFPMVGIRKTWFAPLVRRPIAEEQIDEVTSIRGSFFNVAERLELVSFKQG